MNRFRRKKGQKGFTMIELMVVVVIVGILAAIAIPIYGKYIKNARQTEATGRLAEIVTSAKAWAQENDNWPTQAEFAANEGVLDGTPTENFTYAITQSGPKTAAFQVQATGTTAKVGVGTLITMSLANINATGQITMDIH
jgi:prepilin-type N-terminal cleavage/methylation domain-containing protein